jgi:NMD protein affecting ribosome stability and mRNA decay
MKAARPAGFHKRRRTQTWTDIEHDAYRGGAKLPEPTLCPDCSAVYHKGRWQWAAAPEGAHKTRCPACLRIHHDFPAGYVTLSGKFLEQHREEIMHLLKNEESREKAEHPLQRIMKIEDEGKDVQVTTTDNHLARAMGEALHRAYQGELQINYNREDDLVRVSWSRGT